MLCRLGKEDIEHVLLSCPAYGQHREKLLTSVARSYSRGNSGANILDEGEDRLIEVLLGANAGCKLTEDEVDRAEGVEGPESCHTRYQPGIWPDGCAMDGQRTRMVSAKSDRSLESQSRAFSWNEKEGFAPSYARALRGG